MFIEGDSIPPRTWRARADDLLHPELEALVTITRPVNLAALKATGDAEPLQAVSLAELHAHLAANRDAALYVAPGITVAAPTSGKAFLAEAREAESHWHRRLRRHLGKDRKSLARSLDLPARMLVFHGVLLAAGHVHLPGCWPDRQPSKADLGQTSYGSPTVPPGFLGLDTSVPDGFLPHGSTACPQGPNTGGPNATTLNDLFQTLVQTGESSPR